MDAKKENTAFEDEKSERAVSCVEISNKVFEEDEKLKKEREKESVRNAIKNVILGTLWMFIAYLLGKAELPFGAMPLGVALLCSASSKVVYIYTGLCFSSFAGAQDPLVCICAYTAVLFIRVISRIVIDSPFEDDERELPQTVGEFLPFLFSEHIFLRIATASVGAFIIGIYSLVKGGFLYYDLFGMLISIGGAALAVYLYSGLSGIGAPLGIKRGTVSFSVSEGRIFTAVCSISASLVWAADGLTLVGMPLSVFGAMAITLYYSRRSGFTYGLVTGTVCGIAYSPMLAPVFAFAAIVSGALWKVSVFFACLSACTVGMAWALYVEGISALTSILPASLAAALIFAVVDKLYFGERLKKQDVSDEEEEAEEIPDLELDDMTSANTADFMTFGNCAVLGKDALGQIMVSDTEEKITMLCETFSSLSSLFYSLSEKMRTPAMSDLKQICDNAFESSCQRCELRSVCWENEYTSSLSALGKISSVLGKNGHIVKEDIPAHLLSRCSYMPDIIDQINHNSMMHTQQLIIGDKTEIFALDYESISELLGALLTSQRAEFEYKEELSLSAKRAMDSNGIMLKSIFAYSNGRQYFFALADKDGSEISEKKSKIKELLEVVCGEELECRSFEGDEAIFSSARKYKIEYAKRSVKAEGEEGFCGDTLNVFENGKEHFYSFISDGMGSGREAALTSGICSVFLSKILSATSRCDISLEMLNGFLRNKGSGSMHECSATVDLLDLDLITGKAEFYKSGAAPSYIFRDGNLFKLRSNTVPLGIIKELDTKKISIDIGMDDIIVMVSDGVTQSKDECPWLFDLLKATARKESLASIADMIVKRAKYEGADDDVSVIVMKVGEV